eukprot:XP_014782644.1 PREDICTED: uncharacterized protein LOC106878064 [Octopus bimaculoides]
MLTAVIQKIWKKEVMPKDWKDEAMEIVFKGKGQKDECNNFRGICPLATAGKVLSRIILDWLQIYVVNEILPESQSGFRKVKVTTDMIFSARQLQGKCVEQQIGLYQVFIGLTRSFDSVNRTALWEILRRLGWPAPMKAYISDIAQQEKSLTLEGFQLSQGRPQLLLDYKRL